MIKHRDEQFDITATSIVDNKQEKNFFGGDVEIIKQDSEGTRYRISAQDGDVILSSYRVFDGIYLIYNDVHTKGYRIEKKDSGDILQINHCLEGRIEYSLNEQEYIFLEPGDMSINFVSDEESHFCFPTGHYHGITIMIDTKKAPNCLSCFLDDVDVKPVALAEKFCKNKCGYISRSEECFEHIFSELYSVKDSIRKGYFKIKVLEILLFLSGMDINEKELDKRSYTKSQVELAKAISRYIADNLSEKITIDELSNIFHVSPTHLKNCFKGVFGVSVYVYIRTQKMAAAARILKTTNLTIIDIASQMGYDNGSKFAKAFKDVVGVTPTEYRALTCE
ncbi:MAG: AraC family transcriptional regulator [Eubacteriales bacterium]|nr:AraC family transcriptional regulator [Eubacteriales bacterium]MDY3332216.1 AraC family transcriptional regulator [Gallibacter sp.]